MKALIVITDSEAMAEPEVEDALAFLRKVRDAAGVGDETKLYVAAVHEVR